MSQAIQEIGKKLEGHSDTYITGYLVGMIRVLSSDDDKIIMSAFDKVNELFGGQIRKKFEEIINERENIK